MITIVNDFDGFVHTAGDYLIGVILVPITGQNLNVSRRSACRASKTTQLHRQVYLVVMRLDGLRGRVARA